MGFKHFPTENLHELFPYWNITTNNWCFLPIGFTSVLIKQNQIILIFLPEFLACFLATKWIILLNVHSLKFSGDSVWLICSLVIKSNKLTFLGMQAERTRLKHVLDRICYVVAFCWWTHWTSQDEICNVISLTYYPQGKICFYLSCPGFFFSTP